MDDDDLKRYFRLHMSLARAKQAALVQIVKMLSDSVHAEFSVEGGERVGFEEAYKQLCDLQRQALLIQIEDRNPSDAAWIQLALDEIEKRDGADPF